MLFEEIPMQFLPLSQDRFLLSLELPPFHTVYYYYYLLIIYYYLYTYKGLIVRTRRRA